MNAASPSSTGPAGPLFEGQVGAYYLLSLLTGAPPRGLPGTTIQRIELQRGSEGHALDDVIINALEPQGRQATLAIQVKRSIKFTPTDTIFRAVVGQIAATMQQTGFWDSRYELAIAIARTSQKIDGAYQEVLSWARALGSATEFMDRLNRAGSANDDMRTFVATLRSHLVTFAAASDDETVWRLLRRLQILVFDFTATGSATEALMHERAASALRPDDSAQSAVLWSALVELALQVAAVGGERTRERLVQDVTERSFRLACSRNFAPAGAHLREAASHALADIDDRIGTVILTRHERLTAVREALDKGRYVEIRGEAGVGKSVVLKHLATQLAQESQVILLAPNRTIPNGWSALRATLGFDGTAHELLVDLAASGGAILFVDNLDNFSDAEQRTVVDLVREAATIPGISVVTTARLGFGTDEPNWLPADALVTLVPAPPVTIGELTDAEIAELKAAAPALATLLADAHPARDVVRNLYRLARLSTLPLDAPVPRTEIDMAQQWWDSADGRRDNGHRDRARLLRALADQSLASRQVLDVAGHPSSAVDALIRSGTLRDLQGDRVTFRHDVLREWAVANLLYLEPEALERLPLTRPAPVWAARAVELTGRLALERAPDDVPWDALLKRVSEAGHHGSWRRAVILSSVRSEAAPVLLTRLSGRLLQEKAALLRELIRTVMAVEVVPLSESLLAAGVERTAIPTGLNAPSSPAWVRLIVFTLSLGQEIPPAAIPDVAALYSGWCWGTLGRDPLTPILLSALYRWLSEIEATRGPERRTARGEIFGGELQEHQVKALEETLRGTFVLFANRVPSLAAEYLTSLLDRPTHDATIGSILKFRGTLAQAAPAELAQLTLTALIPSEDLARPFSFADHQFLPASPAQGPFYELLVNAPERGTALIRQLVDRAIAYYSDGRAPGADLIPIAFPEGERHFPWKRSYFWSRDEGGHSALTSGLMALEAWSHGRIEVGTPIGDVLADVLGSGEAPAAYVLVAVDLILSHWPNSREAAIPFLASPELLCLDRQRMIYDNLEAPDIFGLKATQGEPRGPSTLAALKKRPSRQRILDAVLGEYAVGSAVEGRERLRLLLQQASARLGPPGPDTDLGDPSFMVVHALNLIDPSNWKEVMVKLRNGESATALQYVSPIAETEHLQPQQQAASGPQRDSTIEAAVALALDNPQRSSPDLVAAAVAWAQNPPENPTTDDEERDRRWMREQAVFSAALILMRDGSAEMRALHANWARGVFAQALQTEEDPGRSVRSGLRFNPIAIAFGGLAYLLRDQASPADLRTLLGVAAREEPAGAHGFAVASPLLAGLDGRLPRAILRCAFAACVHSRPEWNASRETRAALTERYRRRLQSVVDAEVTWLAGEAPEPAWPGFPAEPLRGRRGLRLRRTEPPEESRGEPASSEEYVNHRAAAIWLRAVLKQGMAQAPWACAIILAYSEWTFRANGSGLPPEEDVENAPDEWNQAYFELLGKLLNSCNLVDFAVESISRLPDEPLFDVLPTFLRALDEIYFDTQGIEGAQAVDVRTRLAARLSTSYRWSRLRGTTSDSIEMHIGPAIASFFFNYFYPFAAPPKCYLNPPAIDRIDPFLPVLRGLVDNACQFVALVTLNLLEVSPRVSHLPLLVTAASAWLDVYPDDTVFWVERDIGKRVCAVIDRAWRGNEPAPEPSIRAGVDRVLAALVRLGVPEATALEMELARRNTIP